MLPTDRRQEPYDQRTSYSLRGAGEGGYTHLGLVYANGNDYYGLFGEKKDLNTIEGQAYQKIDNAIIEYAEFTEKTMRDPSYDNNGLGYPSTDFTMNNNRWFNIQYENSIYGIIRPNKSEPNNAYMEEWIGKGDQPKIISSWQDKNIKLYHILLRDKRPNRNRDIVHLKYDKKNAMRLLSMYYNLFPNQKPRSK